MSAAEAKLSRLSTDLKVTNSSDNLQRLAKHVEKLPESWEDDADDEPVEAPGPSLRQTMSNDEPSPPPPTPISPTSNMKHVSSWSNTDGGRPTPRANDDRRPEKTTSAANRMIAGALGMRAPKKTDDQKQYEAAVKESELKRRNKEKEDRDREKAESDRAQAAIWDA